MAITDAQLALRKSSGNFSIDINSSPTQGEMQLTTQGLALI